ncbi:hypothetical protein GT347_00700 [Xylophilus rhododendri]|uniref:Uncharacterized protein n=1 Tax=Xylophilus rhododendri TaxID=2697032 RepID=A0A857IYL0_9BURK|nr:hypothetical protein [Xylophilus rhododendri]QHI96644.1 hypothetical protein GT347_00700 [Xylophilus rhododendri]
MRHHRFSILGTLLAAASVTALPALAQSAAQSQYQQQLAACDPAQPRPAYNACIRAAGAVLDRSGAVGSATAVDQSSDGRATILEAPGGPSVSYSTTPVVPQTTTSQDGRATLLVPSDSTMRSGTVLP